MGTHRFQLDSINATEVGNLSEPGLVATTLAARPQIDVTLANDAFLPDLTEAMAQFGYSFVASAPTTPRVTSNLLVDMSDPGATTTVAPAGTIRQRYDNTQKALLVSVDGGAFYPLGVPPPNGASFFDDFLTINGTVIGNGWTAATSGAGSAVTVGSGVPGNVMLTGARQGILSLASGTTATGRASARQAQAYSNLAATGGNSRLEWLTAMADPLATVAEDYTYFCGYSDSIGGAGFGTQAVLFAHIRAVSATNWIARTVVGGVPTDIVTAIPISAAGTFDKLLIDISPVIGIRFFVNGVLAATQVTMPIASVVYTPITKIEKLAGITTRRVNMDYASWSYRLSVAR
jgi:hypothetical protein